VAELMGREGTWDEVGEAEREAAEQERRGGERVLTRPRLGWARQGEGG
jgi:hypothetical protein